MMDYNIEMNNQLIIIGTGFNQLGATDHVLVIGVW